MKRKPNKLAHAVAVTLGGREVQYDKAGNALFSPATWQAEKARAIGSQEQAVAVVTTIPETELVHAPRDTARHPHDKRQRKTIR